MFEERRPSGLLVYFLEGRPPSAGDVVAHLWNDATAPPPAGDSRTYDAALLEQYRLYVEMADRVSARRGVANTFFLTLNTTVLTLIGTLWEERPHASTWWLVFPLVALLVECMTWYWTIRSYRQLNSAKWAVVGRWRRAFPRLRTGGPNGTPSGGEGTRLATGRSRTWSSGSPTSSP